VNATCLTANIFLNLKQKKNSVNISVTADELNLKIFYNEEVTNRKQLRMCVQINIMMYITPKLPNSDNWWLGCGAGLVVDQQVASLTSRHPLEG